MLLPCICESWDLAAFVAGQLEDEMNEYGKLSMVSVYKLLDELLLITFSSRFNKPDWLYDIELNFKNEKRGWLIQDFNIHIHLKRWYGGSGYVLEVPEPIDF